MSQLPIRIIPGTENGSVPSITINAQGEMFMARRQGGGDQIYLSISFDQGASWGRDMPIPNATSALAPSVAFIGEQLFVAWVADDGSNILYYTYSDDNGQNFVPVVPVNDVVTRNAPTLIGGGFGAVIFQAPDGQAQMALIR